jgi:hypothetical protein
VHSGSSVLRVMVSSYSPPDGFKKRIVFLLYWYEVAGCRTAPFTLLHYWVCDGIDSITTKSMFVMLSDDPHDAQAVTGEIPPSLPRPCTIISQLPLTVGILGLSSDTANI